MSKPYSLLGTAVAAALLCAGTAQADVIATTQITPTTTLPFFTFGSQRFTIDQVADGITADSPFNGFAANGITSGRITLTLDQAYDLDSFTLWNDINVSNEGVRSFTLSFEDAGGGWLGTSGTLLSVSQLAPQLYTFASTVVGVKTVQLDVLTSSLQIEIRELAFNGVAAVPEPGTWATMLAGLAALGWMRRRTSA
jgi:PEP-CTERM motif